MVGNRNSRLRQPGAKWRQVERSGALDGWAGKGEASDWGGGEETACPIVIGLENVSNFDCSANKMEAYGTSHCIMAEVPVDAVVSVVPGSGRAFFGSIG
jgi:hypothetical protein